MAGAAAQQFEPSISSSRHRSSLPRMHVLIRGKIDCMADTRGSADREVRLAGSLKSAAAAATRSRWVRLPLGNASSMQQTCNLLVALSLATGSSCASLDHRSLAPLFLSSSSSIIQLLMLPITATTAVLSGFI